MTLAAEVKIINNALDNAYTWSANNSIPGYVTTRETISSKVQNINYNYIEDTKQKDAPEVIYIKAGEVHTNLQSRRKGAKNRIAPVILTYEEGKEEFLKKKELKNNTIYLLQYLNLINYRKKLTIIWIEDMI